MQAKTIAIVAGCLAAIAYLVFWGRPILDRLATWIIERLPSGRGR